MNKVLSVKPLSKRGGRIKRCLLCFFVIFSLTLGAVPLYSAAAPSFTPVIQDRFVSAILELGGNKYEYNRYALHDFDGDNIPEILVGNANPADALFCNYTVLKYDVIGDRFVSIGHIAESRYLMRDRYSNALIGLYQDPPNGFKIYRNYYFANGTLARNTLLSSLVGTRAQNALVYDGVQIDRGLYYNDHNRLHGVTIDQDRFDELELAIRGSYDEVIVHDMHGFVAEVALIAVKSWKPVVISRKPITFSNQDRFTKTWQMPMYDLIMSKLGPASTYYDEFDIYYGPLKEKYQRFALHDIDGDNVPELFLGVLRGTKMSFDVYRYWNRNMQFIGSFDSYSKYLAIAPGGVFAFNPAPNMFHEQAAMKISFVNNMIQTDTLLMSYYKDNKYNYFAPDRSNRNLANITYNSYRNSLVNYVTSYTEIKTFDIDMVPPSAALIMYQKTKAFTLQ